MARHCEKCQNEIYNESIEIFTYSKEVYYLCPDCAFEVKKFIGII